MLCLQIMNIILIKQVWIWNTTIRLQRLTIQVLSWKEYVVRDVYAVSTVLTEMTKKNMFYQSNGKQNRRWTNESVWLACSYIENRIQCIYFICWHVVDCRNVWHNLTQIKRTTFWWNLKHTTKYQRGLNWCVSSNWTFGDFLVSLRSAISIYCWAFTFMLFWIVVRNMNKH